MIVGSGLLVVLAGVLESKNGLPPVEIPVRRDHRSRRLHVGPCDGQAPRPGR